MTRREVNHINSNNTTTTGSNDIGKISTHRPLSSRPKLRNITFACGVMIVFIIILILCLKKDDDINTYRIENASLYSWFNMEKLEYNQSELVFDRNNTITELKTSADSTPVIESTPFFYTYEQKILFPQEMDLVQPRANNGQQDRIPSLSLIDGTDVEPHIVFGEHRGVLGSAFIFDGSDLYFFINPVTIQANNEEFSLPSFSFATYNYNHELYLYPYDKSDEVIYLEGINSAIAQADGYSIDLSKDTFERNGSSHLLIKNVNRLEVLK